MSTWHSSPQVLMVDRPRKGAVVNSSSREFPLCMDLSRKCNNQQRPPRPPPPAKADAPFPPPLPHIARPVKSGRVRVVSCSVGLIGQVADFRQDHVTYTSTFYGSDRRRLRQPSARQQPPSARRQLPSARQQPRPSRPQSPPPRPQSFPSRVVDRPPPGVVPGAGGFVAETAGVVRGGGWAP